jgi:predicted permease
MRLRLDPVLHDLRFAARALLRDRAFTFTAVALLALAVGANVAAFAVMNTMLYRGFPLVERNDRLVYVQESGPGRTCCVSFASFEDWRAQTTSFDGMAFVDGRTIAVRSGGDRAERTAATAVTTNTFVLLGVRPALGRDFGAADDAPGAPRVAILSYAYWQSRFAGGDVVGSTLRIDDVAATVIGVMPRGFAFPDRGSLWFPLERTPELLSRQPTGYFAFGRLEDGADVAGARSAIEAVSRRLAADYPATNRDVVPRVRTYTEFFVGPDAPVIYGSLWAASWFVLLIACANLANLALSRTAGRSRDISTRIALGAGTWRMARQFLVEALLLAAAGGALGGWVGWWCVRAWAAATESRYQVLDYGLGAGTLAYVAAASLVAAAAFGIVPALRMRALDVVATLKGGGRGATQVRGGKRVGAALVAGQMALAIVLLAGAGVLVRSFSEVVFAEVGVRDAERVLTGVVELPANEYATPESRLAFYDRLTAQLASIAGVERVSLASTAPVNIPGTRRFDVDGEAADGAAREVVTVASASDYFRTVGASTLAGRDFDGRDSLGTQPVAIVNQRFAAEHWPGQDPVGKRVRLYARGEPGDWLTVVGVASNVMQGDPTRQRFLPIVYVPFRQTLDADAVLFARAGGPAGPLAVAVRAQVQALDPSLRLDAVSTLKESFAFRRDRMDIEHAEMGKHAAVAPILAAIALVLAAVGLYAVVSHSVGRRTKEIGIRIAIGAALGDIRALVLRDGLRPVAVGTCAGLAASLAVNRVLESQLVGVSPYDPVALAAAPLVLIAVAVAGCWLPARRAMRSDPVVALRQD